MIGPHLYEFKGKLSCFCPGNALILSVFELDGFPRKTKKIDALEIDAYLGFGLDL